MWWDQGESGEEEKFLNKHPALQKKFGLGVGKLVQKNSLRRKYHHRALRL
jgi:hypothetical protein